VNHKAIKNRKNKEVEKEQKQQPSKETVTQLAMNNNVFIMGEDDHTHSFLLCVSLPYLLEIFQIMVPIEWYKFCV
jgi:hypothetical protein